jgi:hypothetical protein
MIKSLVRKINPEDSSNQKIVGLKLLLGKKR